MSKAEEALFSMTNETVAKLLQEAPKHKGFWKSNQQVHHPAKGLCIAWLTAPLTLSELTSIGIFPAACAASV